MLELGRRYLFMTQRYAWSGTVEHVSPTHAKLGTDAMVHYEDIGKFEDWASGKIKWGERPGGLVSGQVVSLVGSDATPCP